MHRYPVTGWNAILNAETFAQMDIRDFSQLWHYLGKAVRVHAELRYPLPILMKTKRD